MSKLKTNSLIIISVFLLISSSLFADSPQVTFEIGDAIYAQKPGWLPDWWKLSFGHAGIYYGWDSSKGDPSEHANHKTFEAFGYSGGLLPIHLDPEKEVGFGTFDKFHNRGFYSVRTKFGLPQWKRQKIVTLAGFQDDCLYDFTWGYKNPYGEAREWSFPPPLYIPVPSITKIPPSFRCDGLVEWLYEQIGIDIIPHDVWGPPHWVVYKELHPHTWPCILTPVGQMNSLDLRSEATPPKVEILGFDSDNRPVAYAGDGEYGSGVTRVEFYNGPPDDGTLIGVNEDKRDIEGYYTAGPPKDPVTGEPIPLEIFLSNLEGLSLNNLWARAYDQAGKEFRV